MQPPVALTIAGSDSGGCAGIQADLRTFAAHGVHGTSVVTALTAQNTLGVAAAEPVGLAMLEAQLESVLADFDVAAVKTGMLADLHTLVVVGGAARAGRLRNLVIDPVLVTTAGDSLFDGDPGAYLDAFGDAPALLTPNIPEAEALTGGRIGDLDGMREAARSLASIGPCPVLVTGATSSATPPSTSSTTAATSPNSRPRASTPTTPTAPAARSRPRSPRASPAGSACSTLSARPRSI
ncbi:hypothetical protein GCM10029992_28980 [Glycomyces albus]